MRFDNPTGNSQLTTTPVALYIISGGVGASGEQIVRTVLAQFPHSEVAITIFTKVYTKEQVKQILSQALEENAIVTHTFVDSQLRQSVQESAQELGLVAIDLVGALMDCLAERIGQDPLGKPGLYRQLYGSYFDRITAMDYTLAHDDGMNSKGWEDAEVILLGASRVGKTPISLYLSVLGWKVANIPLVSGIPPDPALKELDKRKMVGLTISPGELVEHRRYRQNALGVKSGRSDYTDAKKVFEEIETLEKYFRRNNISIIDVSGKPIETSADEILRLIQRKI